MPLVPRMAIRMTLEFYRGASGALASVGLRAREHARHLARRGFADGPVLEPAGDIFVVDALPPLYFAALGQDTSPVLRQIPERLERGVFPNQAAGHHHGVAHRNREPVAAI